MTNFDQKLTEHTGTRPFSDALGNIPFWFVIPMFLPAILATFALSGILAAVQAMVDKILSIVPNLFAACVIGVVGWIVARVLRALVTNLLSATGVEHLASNAGSPTPVDLPKLAGTLVYLFVFVPTLIAALNALGIEAISRPAIGMLNQFLSAVPDIVAAMMILIVTLYVSRFIATLMLKILVAAGADGLPATLGLKRVFVGILQPSKLVARLIVFFAMLFATIEAANRLGFTQVRDAVTLFILFGGHVMTGCVILAIGFWLATIARRVIEQSDGEHSVLFARMVQFAVLGLVFAMGLSAMGIANQIVELAFGLVLGAIAVALSFGLGGREAAAELLERWIDADRKRH
ncbi:Conserved TM helix repeat-containing protein [Burkholderia ambifaria IOP40-10]|jgi:hypothetical protein|uniref:Small-conductance mechanosensitive channel n=1 Tax=Burkholderia ambifaria IOP40-10 TaxID=396596 RepID=B1FBH0_9BURK|nr:Conserved TM helix repeat-containing protein [Burkholderia ambifaria IOP40-10]